MLANGIPDQGMWGMWGSTPFEITETVDGEGVVRLAVAGELDFATKGELERRLLELSCHPTAIRIDLSQLEFIDAGGIRTLVTATAGTARLELDHRPAPRVSRMLAAFGLDFAKKGRGPGG